MEMTEAGSESIADPIQVSDLESQLKEKQRKIGELEGNIISLKSALKIVSEEDKYWTQELDSEKQKFQSQIAALSEKNTQLDEAQKELQATIKQLEKQLRENAEKECALHAEIDNLKANMRKKSALLERLQKNTENFRKKVAEFKEKAKNFKEDATAKEDSLKRQVQKLEQELQLSQVTVTKLTEEGLAKVSQLEAARSHATKELEDEKKKVILLRKKVEKLEQKLAEAESKEKAKEDNAIIEKKLRIVESPALKNCKSIALSLILAVASNIIIGIIIGTTSEKIFSFLRQYFRLSG